MKSNAKRSLALMIGLVIFTIIYANNIFSQNPHKPDSKGKMVLLDKLIYEYNLTESELLSLQYYVNIKFVLKATATKTDRNKDLSSSSFTTDRVTYNSEITIPAYTPGVAIKASSSSITIDFGDGVIIPFNYHNIKVGTYDGIFGYAAPVGESVTINSTEYSINVPPTISLNMRDCGVPYLLIDPFTETSRSRTEIQSKTVTGKTIKK